MGAWSSWGGDAAQILTGEQQMILAQKGRKGAGPAGAGRRLLSGREKFAVYRQPQPELHPGGRCPRNITIAARYPANDHRRARKRWGRKRLWPAIGMESAFQVGETLFIPD
ncbi:MAG: hypothetical protein ACLR23_08350 [Clostridia bacterium]